jgi:hypothetical protein
MNPPRRTSLIALLVAWLFAATACSAVVPTVLPPTQSNATHTPSAQGLPTRRATPAQDLPGQARLDSVEILVLESFPVQIRALVSGSLPDSCTTIDRIAQTREGNAFRVTISTVRAVDKVCSQSLVPFEETIALQVAGIQAGDYSVTVNDMTTTFRLSTDNVAETRPQPDRVIVGEAAVSRVEVRSESGDASSLTLVLLGNLPDGCTKIARVTQAVEGHVLRITLVTERPADLMCTEALVPFEQIVATEAASLPTGTITVVANGAKATLERP